MKIIISSLTLNNIMIGGQLDFSTKQLFLKKYEKESNYEASCIPNMNWINYHLSALELLLTENKSRSKNYYGNK